jgi:glycosyltransferase involved in cell wall biosynthesis
LLIIGEGPLDINILEEAQRLGLSVFSDEEHPPAEADIYMPGFRINPYPYLSRARVFVMTSVYEGFPNVIIEAMASGLPVVSSDCTSGPREILDPGSDISYSINDLEFAPYGILTPVYDAEQNNAEKYSEAASRAVITLLTDHEKRNHYIKQSLARAAYYDREIIMRQWIQIIEGNIEDTIHP